MMKVRQETDAVWLHIQKVAGFFSGMRLFAGGFAHIGHRVAYLRLDDPHNEQSFDANLMCLIREQHTTRLEYMQPDSWSGYPQRAGTLSVRRYGCDNIHPLRHGLWKETKS